MEQSGVDVLPGNSTQTNTGHQDTKDRVFTLPRSDDELERDLKRERKREREKKKREGKKD